MPRVNVLRRHCSSDTISESTFVVSSKLTNHSTEEPTISFPAIRRGRCPELRTEQRQTTRLTIRKSDHLDFQGLEYEARTGTLLSSSIEAL